MRFFFYGTLRDADVRRKVIGPAVARLAIEPATLPGYACVFMRGRPYPVLRAREGAAAEGVLTAPLAAVEAARIDRFETDEYRAGPATVLTEAGEPVTARVYFAARSGLASEVPWSLADWQRRHKKTLLRTWF